jgi:hypothetical protein
MNELMVDKLDTTFVKEFGHDIILGTDTGYVLVCP